MKRLASTDSLGALMICPSTEEYNGGKGHVYSREFQCMLEGIDEEGCVEECGQKKRRLSVDQVKALEKNFEVENKLEPERKVKLAQELGLQPRQVAVWFQNRRARWKTKQLERDYGVLKASYEALKHNYDRLQHENEALDKEVKELKSKLDGEENNESNASVKVEEVPSQKDDKIMKRVEPPPVSDLANSDDTELNYESFNNGGGVIMGGSTFFPDLKDGSSDSDSSAILNDDNNSNSPNYSSGILQSHHQFMPPANCFPFQETTAKAILGDEKPAYLPQFVKIEEHNFFSGEESCNFFSDDQAPTLQWYCHEQWN